MDKYLPRIIDSKLDSCLESFGAVSVVGPKWVGKTRTCLEHAASSFSFTRKKGEPDPLELARLDSRYVFQGEKPHLIDEWQIMPEVWDMVRSDVDDSGKKGLYLLTGSNIPPKLKKGNVIRHSGIGRIAKLRMHTMTLYETEDSSGEVSLASLFENEPVYGTIRNISLPEIIHFIVRGGWPANIGSGNPSAVPSSYIDGLIEEQLDELAGIRVDKMKFRRLLKSLARNESTVCSVRTLRNDTAEAGSMLDDETITTYLNVLNDLYLLDDQEGFSPDFRSRMRFKTGAKRHLADPSLAAAAVDANETNLTKDLRYLGFLFESLAEHDLKIYIEALDGTLSHYQDYSNSEVDAVVTLPDGRFGFIEIKLGYEGVVDGAAASLIKTAGRLEKQPSFLAVVSGMANAPYRRKDGVYVIPLTSLKP